MIKQIKTIFMFNLENWGWVLVFIAKIQLLPTRVDVFQLLVPPPPPPPPGTKYKTQYKSHVCQVKCQTIYLI